MKIRVSITREYDTTGDHTELFEGISMPESYALSLFADDIDRMATYNTVVKEATVEVSERV